MGLASQQLATRPVCPTAAAHTPVSRCTSWRCTSAAILPHQASFPLTTSASKIAVASRPAHSGALPYVTRRGQQCWPPQTSAADQGPTADRPREDSSEADEQQLIQKVADFGKAVAQSQEAAFLAAQDQLRQQREAQQQAQQAEQTQHAQQSQQVGRDKAAIAGAAAGAPTAAAFVGGATGRAGTTPPAVASASAPGSAPGAAASRPAGDAAAPAAVGKGGAVDLAAAVREKLARAAEYRKAKQEEEAKAAEAGEDADSPGSSGPARPAVSGSADVAAGFLASVMQNSTAPSPNKDISMEKFTELKEQERRRNVEIITVDREYAPEKGGGYAEGYKPKVATWGMFPRPNNISKAYGGGRTLKPGEALESEDAKAARSRRVGEAMKRYRQSTGLDVDPAIQAQAQARLDSGMVDFRRGQLTTALVHFTDAAALMPLRSPIGGTARLQQAITLDSMGKSQEAKAMYQSLRGHPTGEISKKVKHLLGGFEAMTFLKADQFSYAVKPHEYAQYFRRMQSTYSNVYTVNPGEEEDLRAPTFIAVAVMLVPILLLGAKIVQKYF